MTGTITLLRKSTGSICVPVTLTVTDRGAVSAGFVVIPEVLQLSGAGSEVVSFTLRLRPAPSLRKSTQVDALAGGFKAASGLSTPVVVDVHGGKPVTLRPGVPLDLKGTLLMPTSGQAKGQIVLRSSAGGRIVVPVQLTIQN